MSNFLPFDRMGGAGPSGGPPERGRARRPLLPPVAERPAALPPHAAPPPAPVAAPAAPSPPAVEIRAGSSAPDAAPPREDRPNYDKFLIWLRGHFLIGLLAFGISGGLVFSCSVKTAPPVYKSEMTIKFNFKDDLADKIPFLTNLAPNDRVEAEMEVIKSDQVLKRVLQEADDPALRIDDSTPSDVVEGRIQALRGGIAFEHGDWINVLIVYMSDQVPERAQQLLSGLCRAYIAYDTERRRENDRQQYQFLAHELDGLQKSMQGLEDVLLGIQEVEKLETEIDRIGRDIRGHDEEIGKVRTELSLKREQLVRDFTPKYPEVAEIDSTLSQIEEIRRETRVAELGKFREKTLERVSLLRFQMLVAMENQERHRARIREIEDALRAQGFADPSPVVVREELQAKQQNFQLFDRTKSSIQLNLARSEHNEKIELLREEATFPGSPVINNVNSKVTIAVVAGAFVALVVLWGLYQTNQSIFDPQEIESTLGVSLLATIPRSAMRGAKAGGLKDFFAEGPEVVADYFEILATTLRSWSSSGPMRLLVSSADAQEGKSTVSLNLAIALARLGQETVLIGSNLRRPTLYRFIEGYDHPKGIIDCARDERLDLRSFVKKTKYERLSFIAAGDVGSGSALATQYLRTPRFRETLDAYRREGTVVLLDSSPILLVSDPQILASLVDGVILVYHAGQTPLRRAERALSILRRSGAKVLGVVANSRFVDRASSYRRPYRRTAQEQQA